MVLTSPSGNAPLRPICFMSSKAPPALRRSKRRSEVILLSTRMFSSGRSQSRSAWVYAENKPLEVLGVPLVPAIFHRDGFFVTFSLLDGFRRFRACCDSAQALNNAQKAFPGKLAELCGAPHVAAHANQTGARIGKGAALAVVRTALLPLCAFLSIT